MKNHLATFLLCFLSLQFYAQPINDDCSGIIDLGVAPLCPIPDTFHNVNATPSVVFSNASDNIPTCYTGGVVNRDVWFEFTVPLDLVDFMITVTGVDGPNGSIVQPQIAVYRGECLLDELVELACATSNLGATSVTVELEGLTPALPYFLRISDWSASASPNSGDFVLCIDELAQTYIMGQDTESDACSGTLYDSGGPDGSYSNNENFTFTICPDILTNCIELDLASATIETNFDNLTFFAGPDTNAPQMGNITGNSGSLEFQSGTECVTIQFTSDFSVTQPGFELTWQCAPDLCETTFIPCEETQAIFGLPFFANGQTTCNSGNDVDEGPCPDSAGLLEGEDFIYTYNPFMDECIEIIVTGANLNTGLSVYNECPESATNCLGFAQNENSDTLVIQNISLTAFQPIFIVLSNGEGCTDFNIEVSSLDCPVTAPARPVCEDALLLNNCGDLPDLFGVFQQSTPDPDYFQVGINDGCWPGIGQAHYSWLFFQAQADGDFGFIAQNGNEFEASNLNFQVWGPISDFETMCEFIETNQPIRSTGALNEMSSLTGLTNIHPISNDPITDECEGEAGDGFVSALPVQEGMIYLILMNDFDGNIVNGGVQLDFSPTTEGVLDGLPEDTPLSAEEFTLNGDAFYNPQNFDYSCIQITAAQTTQVSCVWAANLVDFSQAFSQNITVYLGNNNAGADGLCMVYHNNPAGVNTCGNPGGGIGSQGIDNSFIIEFDTWQNGNLGDPFQDHIAVNVNGDMGAPIGGPAVLPNIEDGQEHIVVFNWDPSTNTYEIFFDGVLQITGVYDIIQNCFQGSSEAFCGFTGSTGAAVNLQYACTGDNLYPTSSLDSLQVEICEGDSYFVGGAEQTEAGFYTDEYVAFNGCDSTIVTELLIIPAIEIDTLQVDICNGDSYFVGGEEQTEAGFYTDEFTSVNGCDSTVVTELLLIPASQNAIQVIRCEGESYFAGGAFQTNSGIYVDTLQSTVGCDSILTTELFFLFSLDTIMVQLCEGESYFAEGQEQTESGVYTDTFTSSFGCDSVIVSNVEFVPTLAIIEPTTGLDCQIGNCVVLDASNSTTGDNVSYNWTTIGQGFIEEGQGTLSPTICGLDVFTLEVMNTVDGLNCTSSSSIETFFDESIVCEYKIPNAFTPNGDGTNDVFGLIDEGENFEVLNLTIYNRWGQKVHSGSGSSHGWNGQQDGKAAAPDVFVYHFEIRAIGTGEEFVEEGNITLIR